MNDDALESSAYLTTADAGRLLNLTPAAIRLAANTGRLAVAMRTSSGQRLFSRDAVEEFKLAHRDQRRPAGPRS